MGACSNQLTLLNWPVGFQIVVVWHHVADRPTRTFEAGVSYVVAMLKKNYVSRGDIADVTGAAIALSTPPSLGTQVDCYWCLCDVACHVFVVLPGVKEETRGYLRGQ
jgi:hypothetical protein